MVCGGHKIAKFCFQLCLVPVILFLELLALEIDLVFSLHRFDSNSVMSYVGFAGKVISSLWCSCAYSVWWQLMIFVS
jgi:hypothetical protein